MAPAFPPNHSPRLLPYTAVAVLLASIPLAYGTKHILKAIGYAINIIIHQDLLIDPGTNLRLQMHGPIETHLHATHFYFSILSTSLFLFIVARLSVIFRKSKCLFFNPTCNASALNNLSLACSIVIFSAISRSGRTALEIAGAKSWNIAAEGVFKDVLPFSVGPASMILHALGLMLGAWLLGSWISAHSVSQRAHEKKQPIPICPNCGYNVEMLKPRQCPECGLVDVDAKLDTLYLMYPGKSHRRFHFIKALTLISILVLAPLWWMLALNALPVFARPFLLTIEWATFAPWWMLHWFL